MGTWRTFDVSGTAAEAKARVIVDQALAAGANFFDSSPIYGQVERVLGQVGHPDSSKRDQPFMAALVTAAITFNQEEHEPMEEEAR